MSKIIKYLTAITNFLNFLRFFFVLRISFPASNFLRIRKIPEKRTPCDAISCHEGTKSLSRRRSDYRFESLSLRQLMVLVKILKCLTIIRVILLKFKVVKSLKLNKNINTQAKVRQNSHSLFCPFIIFIFSEIFSILIGQKNSAISFLFGEGNSTIYLLKQQKIEKKCGREMLHKIIHWSERFWQEIVFVLIYISYALTFHKSLPCRFDISDRVFPHKNKHFYTFYLQNF